METIIFLFALFTVSVGNAVPRHPNQDLIAKAIQPQHPNGNPILQAVQQADQENINGRIIGGTTVSDAKKYPWQASLRNYGSHSCGAAIISNTWLVTAAHCVQDSQGYYSIKVGSVDRESGGLTRHVLQIISHEDYWQGKGSFPNDIAVIRVSAMSLGGDRIKAVNLAVHGDFAGNRNCTITGWGRTIVGDSDNLPTKLQEANVNVYNNNECEKRWGSSINDGHVCIGDSANERGSCNGDSGGPLTCVQGGANVLVGATSWGVAGCYTRYPSVYSRISFFRDWIKDKTGV